jgi:hypothetical protein
VLSGVELSEPHWHPEQTAALLHGGRFERVLGSVHSVGGRDEPRLVDHAMRAQPAADVVRDYLAEARRMVASDAPFAVLAHIDYPVRHWPAADGPFRPADFEDEFRDVLTVLAGSGGHWRSTRRCRSPRSWCSGGPTPAATPSRSVATRTDQAPWRTGSRRRPTSRWAAGSGLQPTLPTSGSSTGEPTRCSADARPDVAQRADQMERSRVAQSTEQDRQEWSERDRFVALRPTNLSLWYHLRRS